MLVVFAATFIGTVAGFGTAIVMTPILLLFFPLPQTLIFTGVIHLLVDIWQVVLFRDHINSRVLIFFGIPSVILSVIGARVLLVSDYEIIISLLGVFLIVYGLFEIFIRDIRIEDKLINHIAGGAVSGFVSGVSGVGGPIRSVFLQALDMPQKQFIFSVGAVALLVDLGRVIAYLSDGISITVDFWIMVLAMIPVSILSAWVGRRFINRLSSGVFKKVICFFLAIAGLVLILGV